MSMEINSGNYSQFFKGMQDIPSYGSGEGQKKQIARYEFNTTDENGNKIMDKMTKEETMRTMNEISAMYGDSVIVSFSGDGLAALAEGAKGDQSSFRCRDINTGEYVEHDFEAQRKQAEAYWDTMNKLQNTPEVYQEYLRLKGTGQDGAAHSLFAEFTTKTRGLEYKYDGRLSKDGLSLRTESPIDPRDYEDTLQDLSKRYNADFYLGAEVFRQSGSKDYSVELTSDELKTLKSGKGQEKNYLHGLIKEAFSAMNAALRSNQNSLFDQFKFGFSFNNGSLPVFFAQGKDKSEPLFASTMNDLLDKIRG